MPLQESLGMINFRLVVFIATIAFGIFFSLPTFLQTEKGAKITLGLDLQGGLYMLLGIKSEKAIESKMKSLGSSVRYFSEKEDILLESLEINEHSLDFILLDNDDVASIDKLLKEIKGLKITKVGLHFTVELTPAQTEITKTQAIEQAVETIRNRLDQFGLAEPNVARQGVDKILVELPGIKTGEEEQRARALIARAAYLQMMAVDEERAMRAQNMTEREAKSFGDILLPDAEDENRKHLLHAVPIFDGSKIIDASVGFNDANQPVINFTLNSEGAQIFGNFTGKNVGKRLAIVLDGKVMSAPVINERIGGGSGQISGSYTIKGAQDLSIALRSGALQAPVFLMEKRSVGPSLGADSIKSATIALAGGFLLVVIFMFFYYAQAGLIANIALIANLFVIIAVMALFGATLTLPGMAGIVLTVGMAVDANVIISERIRELINQGASAKKAIEQGYSNALSAIMDANITTLIAAVVLYVYGSGPIKGFAITISIGILASMVTAIVGTHGIYDVLLARGKSINLNKLFGIKGVK